MSSLCLAPRADHAFRPGESFWIACRRHDLGRICLSISHAGPLPRNDLRLGGVF
jgi:hypothetical protein